MAEQIRSNSKVNNQYRSDSDRVRGTGTSSYRSSTGRSTASTAGRSAASTAGRNTASTTGRSTASTAGRSAASTAGRNTASTTGRSAASTTGRSAASTTGRSIASTTGRSTASTTGRSTASTGRSGQSGNRNNRALSKRKQQQLKARKRKRFIIILIGILVLAIAITGLLYISRKKAVQAFVQEDHIATGITIDNVDVSGLTIDEAASKWEARMTELSEMAWTFQTSGSNTDIVLSDLGFNVVDRTTDELVEEAYSIVRDGSVWKRYKQIKQLEKTGYNIDVDYTYSREIASIVLGEHCKVMNGAAQNAEIVFTDVDQWSIKESVNGIVVKVDETMAVLDDIFASWDRTAHTVDVVVDEDEPAITTEDLQAIPDVLSSYYTVYGSGNAGRCQNVETGTDHIDGVYLQPGEEVSVDALMRPYTAENGYAEAASYEDGEVVQTMGGGICQVSSTLYNALLFAELEITQRSEHSMLVSYVQPGRDAAIADDVKDLKFKNNLDQPIYVCGWCDGYACYFYIFGKETRDPSRTIAFRSEMITETEYKTQYEDDPELEEGKEKVKTHGNNGGTYKLYKEIYQNGSKIDDEYMTTSVYAPFNEVVQKGTKKVEKSEESDKTENTDYSEDASDSASNDSE